MDISAFDIQQSKAVCFLNIRKRFTSGKVYEEVLQKIQVIDKCHILLCDIVISDKYNQEVAFLAVKLIYQLQNKWRKLPIRLKNNNKITPQENYEFVCKLIQTIKKVFKNQKLSKQLLGIVRLVKHDLVKHHSLIDDMLESQQYFIAGFYTLNAIAKGYVNQSSKDKLIAYTMFRLIYLKKMHQILKKVKESAITNNQVSCLILYLGIKFTTLAIGSDTDFDLCQEMNKIFYFIGQCIEEITKKCIIVKQSQTPQNSQTILIFTKIKKWMCKYASRFLSKSKLKVYQQLFLQNYEDIFKTIKYMLSVHESKQLKYDEINLLWEYMQTAYSILPIQIYSSIKQQCLKQLIPTIIMSQQSFQNIIARDLFTFWHEQGTKQSNQYSNNYSVQLHLAELWSIVAFNMYQNIFTKQNKNTTQLAQASINILKSMILSQQNNEQCAIGAYLMIKLHQKIINQNISQLIKNDTAVEECIIFLFSKQQSIVLQTFAVQIIDNYLPIISHQLVINHFEPLIKLLCQNKNREDQKDPLKVFARGKATTLLYKMFKYLVIPRELTKPQICLIIEVLTSLLIVWKLNVLDFMNIMVSRYIQNNSELAFSLLINLSQCLKKLIALQQSKTNQQKQDNQIISDLINGCLKVVIKIVPLVTNQEYSLKADLLNEIEQIIISTLPSVFSSELKNKSQVDSAIISLLNCYLFHNLKIKQIIPPSLWFYYRVIIYQLVTPPPEVIKQQLNKQQPNIKYQILKECCQYKPDNKSYHYSALRNFIRYLKPNDKLRSENKLQKKMHLANNLQVFMYLISKFIEDNPNQISQQIEEKKTVAAQLLIYFIQTHKQKLGQTIQRKIWNFIKMLSEYTIECGVDFRYIQQALCVFFWAFRESGWILKSINLTFFQQVINSIVRVDHLIDTNKQGVLHSKKRLILGLTSLLRLQLTKKIQNYRFSYLSDWILILVHLTLLYKTKQNFNKLGPEQDENKFTNDRRFGNYFYDQDYSEDQFKEFQIENQYDNSYESELQKVDQIQYFFKYTDWLCDQKCAKFKSVYLGKKLFVESLSMTMSLQRYNNLIQK